MSIHEDNQHVGSAASISQQGLQYRCFELGQAGMLSQFAPELHVCRVSQ